MLRQIQFQSVTAGRLASKHHLLSLYSPVLSPAHKQSHSLSSSTELGLPPLKPTECQFLQLTDTEFHIFKGCSELLQEAVAQCQILGHPVVHVPDYIKELFLQYDNEQAENPAIYSNKKSLGITTRQLSNSHRRPTIKDQKPHSLLSASAKIAKGYFIITVLDMFQSILISHWASMPPTELSYVPKFPHLMLYLCRILGRGPDKYITKFRAYCENLAFVPVRFPGVEYDEDESVPLKTPSQCCDPSLDHYRVGSLSQPTTEFRAPDVLRVLRQWGLRQTLGWAEIVQEGVSKACTIGGCHAQRSQMEAFLYR